MVLSVESHKSLSLRPGIHSQVQLPQERSHKIKIKSNDSYMWWQVTFVVRN